jgi:hypothetical protein
LRERTALVFCLLAGGGDAMTGCLLVTAPHIVVSLLSLRIPEGDLALLRFVGVFVACVGLAYLYPWVLPGGLHRERRLSTAIEMTAGIRLAVALFLGVAVTAGEMDGPWLTVAGYDAAVAVAQLGLLSRGVFGRA